MRSQLGDKAAHSDTLREVQEMLDASEEEYAKLKEMQDKADQYKVYDAKVKLEAEGEDITEIKTLEDYNDYAEKLKAKASEGLSGAAKKEAEETAMAWLKAQESVSEFVKASDKLAYLEDEGIDTSALQDFYDTLDDE
jgi:predicted xylose isomerase-like sugar epimerase